MSTAPRQLAMLCSTLRQRLCAAGAVVLLALAAAVLPARPAVGQVIMKELPEQARGLDLVDKSGQRIPLDLEFTDSTTGRPVRLGDLFDRPATGIAIERRPVVMVMMYFRCPLLCPKLMQEVMSTFNQLEFTVGTEFDAIFVSFDPRDTPIDAERFKTDSLLEYNRTTTQAIRSSMSFLTGSGADSRALADALGFPYRFLESSGEYSHPTVVYVLTPDGVLSRPLTGLRFPERDMRLALVEAAEGRIGSLRDRFTLWCYHFDPREGSYVLQAMRLMQAGGAITVVLLAGLLGALFYTDRRRRRGGHRIRGGEAAQPGGTH